MGSVEVKLKGTLQNTVRLYEHLRYHVKAISDYQEEDGSIVFTVTI